MLEIVDEKPSANKMTHLWILMDNKILIEASPGHKDIHADIWGNEAWDIRTRGYFFEEEGIVSCHGSVQKGFVNKLEKAFDKKDLIAIRFHGYIALENEEVLV
jgi:hypothetical protein